ncbi:(1-3)-beta-glucanase [Micractinium conductrix]|uniref:(1-3)-beta-glucanase n=1 Tax=Micractinium conductrix TaxID=554055 RepID=A0A2P6VLB2_9CHLO|nr:(1-3)-beta-glucanase [Micractinium conductrix]|eukprot:PSC74883.1 (1-3)-beta-glucanase [Micractinium conductrix]
MGVSPRHGDGPVGPAAYELHARATPKWSDDDEGRERRKGHGCCAITKFALWLIVVGCIVAAAVGLSVVMVILQNNREKDNPSSPVDTEGGNGGGSGGSGNGGPLPVPPTAPFDVPADSQAIWWDEFEGSSLDRDLWNYDLGNGEWGWGNNESQSYTSSTANVRVADGNLYITALREGGKYTSGRINTKNTAGFYPGMQLKDGTAFTSVHIEARAQLPPPGKGLWPAFWLFPTGLKYGKWAASGEIDVMESINDMETITQGLHYGGEDPQNVKLMTKTRQGGVPYSDDWHTFGVEWSKDRITVYVDGDPTATYLPREKDPEGGWWTADADATDPAAPFDQPFYVIINLAVGGLWPKYPDASTPFPSTLAIDYVRVDGSSAEEDEGPAAAAPARPPSGGNQQRQQRGSGLLASGPGFKLARTRSSLRIWLTLASPTTADDVTVRCSRQYLEVTQMRACEAGRSPDGICAGTPPPLRRHHVCLPAAIDLEEPVECVVTPRGECYIEAALLQEG